MRPGGRLLRGHTAVARGSAHLRPLPGHGQASGELSPAVRQRPEIPANPANLLPFAPFFPGPSPMHRPIRNIAIIAHVDHGKTTLVDCLLKQSGTFAAHEKIGRAGHGLQRHRARAGHHHPRQELRHPVRRHPHQYRGHPRPRRTSAARVERVLSMVDGVLLLVDAVEGPMPQTRFVTRKALALGLKAIVVVNKIDRPGARPRLGRGPDLRALRQARRHRCAARLSRDLRLGPAGLGRPRHHRAPAGHDRAVRSRAEVCAAAARRRRCTAAAADLHARLQLLCRAHRHRPHPSRLGRHRPVRGAAQRR